MSKQLLYLARFVSVPGAAGNGIAGGTDGPIKGATWGSGPARGEHVPREPL